MRSPLPEKTLATNTESTLTFAGTSWVSMGNIFLSVLKIKKNLVKSSEEIRQQLLLREKLAGNHELLFDAKDCNQNHKKMSKEKPYSSA